MSDKREFHRPSLREDKPNNNARSTSRGSNQRPGISAVHIDAAREMVKLHTKGRLPQSQTSVAVSERPELRPRVNREPVNMTRVSVPAVTHTGDCKNPQCTHCGTVIIPSPKSSFPIHEHPSITVNDWSIFVTKKPILSSSELDYLADTKFEFPLPEMIFGNNSVKLVNEKDGTCIEFNTIDALETLEDSCNFKVSYHKEWLDSRRTDDGAGEGVDKGSVTTGNNNTINSAGNLGGSIKNLGKDLHRLTDLESLKPYDWTYSTKYKGNITYPDKKLLKKSETAKIPIDRLMRPDPILFFDEIVLFEDELGDNGISMLTVKIRVMPTCLLLLCRLFLRIDNVAFRVRDTRIFIDLETSEIIREYKEQESDYDSVLKKICGGSNSKIVDPKGLLRDTNWVAQNIPVTFVEVCTNTPKEKN